MVWLSLLLGLSGCALSQRGVDPVPAEHRVRLSGQTMGTTWSVTAELPEGFSDTAASKAIQAELDQVDQAMSSWRADSEIRLAVAAEGGGAVSGSTAAVIREALAIAKATDGAYDPTVEPLMAVWGFRHNDTGAAPDAQALAEARAKVDWRRVTVEERDAQVWLDPHGTSLDLSSIAKGHAVDRVGEALSRLGSERWLVEVGGEVRGRGGRSESESWRVGVDEPDPEIPPGTSFAAVVQVRDAAVATSGNYRNFHLVDGVRVAHTLDPRAGRPVQTHVLSATVVAPTCQTADGWATALMVVGAEGLSAVEALEGVDALLLLDDGSRVQTSGMEKWL